MATRIVKYLAFGILTLSACVCLCVLTAPTANNSSDNNGQHLAKPSSTRILLKPSGCQPPPTIFRSKRDDDEQPEPEQTSDGAGQSEGSEPIEVAGQESSQPDGGSGTAVEQIQPGEEAAMERPTDDGAQLIEGQVEAAPSADGQTVAQAVEPILAGPADGTSSPPVSLEQPQEQVGPAAEIEIPVQTEKPAPEVSSPQPTVAPTASAESPLVAEGPKQEEAAKVETLPAATPAPDIQAMTEPSVTVQATTTSSAPNVEMPVNSPTTQTETPAAKVEPPMQQQEQIPFPVVTPPQEPAKAEEPNAPPVIMPTQPQIDAAIQKSSVPLVFPEPTMKPALNHANETPTTQSDPVTQLANATVTESSSIPKESTLPVTPVAQISKPVTSFAAVKLQQEVVQIPELAIIANVTAKQEENKTLDKNYDVLSTNDSHKNESSQERRLFISNNIDVDDCRDLVPKEILEMAVQKILAKIQSHNCSDSANLKLKSATNKQIKGQVMESSSVNLNLAKLMGAGGTGGTPQTTCTKVAELGLDPAQPHSLRFNLSIQLEPEDQVLTGVWRRYQRLTMPDDIQLDGFGSGAKRSGIFSSPRGAHPDEPASTRCQRFQVDRGLFRLDVTALQIALNVEVTMIKLDEKSYAIDWRLGGRLHASELQLLGAHLGHSIYLVENGLADSALPTVQILHDRNNHHRRNNWLLDLYGGWLLHEYNAQLSRFMSKSILGPLNSCLRQV